MTAIVEMFRAASAPHGRNRFSCPASIWDFLWELGHAFGWRPQGTTYVIPASSVLESPARRDYQPGGTQDYKQVAAEDAMAWARALEVAKASPHLAGMNAARSAAFDSSGEGGNELLPGVLDEFIQFAYGGAFAFAILSEEAR
jgi:hypothetical protein